MKIIITGAGGFIGSHIAKEYVNQGHEVIAIDNLSYGSKKNISSSIKTYQADIRDHDKMVEIFHVEKPDILSHHAAITEVTQCEEIPNEAYDNNVLGTINLMLATKKWPFKHIIFASSSSVYGEPEVLPVTEESAVSPISVYGLSKTLSEKAIRSYAEKLGFSYTIFRYANAYGPRNGKYGNAGVLSLFVDIMKNGGQPIIYGSGESTRDYVHVYDIAQANKLVLEKGIGKNLVLNIGTGKQVSINDIFKKTASLLDYQQDPDYKPKRSGEIEHMYMNAELAKKELGWSAEVELEEGIKTII